MLLLSMMEMKHIRDLTTQLSSWLSLTLTLHWVKS